MNDGVYRFNVCSISKEIATHHALVQLPAGIIDVIADQFLQLLTDTRRGDHEHLGSTVAVIDGQLPSLRQQAADIRLATTYSPCHTNLHSVSVCSMRNCTRSGEILTWEAPSGIERSCNVSIESGNAISSSREVCAHDRHTHFLLGIDVNFGFQQHLRRFHLSTANRGKRHLLLHIF